MKIKAIVTAFLCLLLSTQSTLAKMPPTSGNNSASLSTMLKKVMPAVVNVTVRGDVPILPAERKKLQEEQRKTGRLAPSRKFESNGSGVIVDAKNGFIVTNAHVIRYAKVLIVTLNDGRMIKAKIIGIDPATDIAVIKVNDKYLSDIPFSDSDKLQAGDFVAAIGNPFGLHQTVTSGVVSALNRSIGLEGPSGYENFIQTDAPINPGNSGGALVDLKGNLVGVNTAILAPMGGNIGIGFAIPSNMVKTVMKQLIQHGHVRRGMLGVMVQTLTPDLADALGAANATGAAVTSLVPGSPAEIAGIQERDVVVSINNQAVKNAAQLRSIVGMLPVGEAAIMKIRRGNKTLTITAIIENIEKINEQLNQDKRLLSGVRLNNFYQKDGGDKEIKGVIVLVVEDSSAAWLAGLRPGDVIIKANNKPITDIAELIQMDKQKPDQMLLSVKRGKGSMFVVIS